MGLRPHIFLILGLLGVATSVEAQPGRDVVDRVHDLYEQMHSLRADFTQATTSVFSDDIEYISGALWLSEDRYRVETSQQTIVTDGVRSWIFNHGENQVLLNDFVEDETTFSISTFFRDFDTTYTISEAEEEPLSGILHTRIDLDAEDPFTFFKSVTLWVRSGDDIVSRLHIVDQNDVSLDIELREIVFNPLLDPSMFMFEPGEGVELVDMRN